MHKPKGAYQMTIGTTFQYSTYIFEILAIGTDTIILASDNRVFEIRIHDEILAGF